ncbi:MAG: NAD(P)/FAD-dependent oxidoreductase [Campylobacteraceae bacterium]|nr:NAD(P)/FAD-dependent oxidoreductase [Campylobacteraceae bacterium]
MPNSVAIVGAGASGLIAAIVAARAGKKVEIYEKNSKIGKKILATGNGRCNITNQTIKTSNYHGLNPKFVNIAIDRFNSLVCKKFFAELGLELDEVQNGRLYPKSLQSSSVTELLGYECERVGVQILLNQEVQSITKKNKKFVLLSENQKIHVTSVLIATGGLAMPTLGASDSGYRFAKNFGHTIVPTFASLVQLETKEDFKSISGVKLQGRIEVYEDKNHASFGSGDILFTNYGISGSAILDVSRVVNKTLQNSTEVNVKLDLLSEYSKEQLKNELLKRAKKSNGKSVSLWLNGFINSKLATFLSKDLRVQNADDLKTKDIINLVYKLKNFKVTVTGSRGFKSAEVTAGGVKTDEINPNTMESKLQKNLYFSGEVLDIDADCGGYNLHWAWASGYSAGIALK